MFYGGGRQRKYPDSNAFEITPEASPPGGRSNAPSSWATVEVHRIPVMTSSTSSTLVGEGSERRSSKNFISEEGCTRGGCCKFLHDEQSRIRASDVVTILPAVGGGLYGSGASGPNPRLLNWKSKICIYWERGHCDLGSRCHYAHGIAAHPYVREIRGFLFLG